MMLEYLEFSEIVSKMVLVLMADVSTMVEINGLRS